MCLSVQSIKGGVAGFSRISQKLPFSSRYLVFAMPRTKIVVSPAALGGRKKPFHVNVSASTTSYQVVAKVLEKLQSRDPPLRYQLWATNSERGEHAKRNITAVYRTARGVLLNAAFMHVVWPHANTCMLLSTGDVSPGGMRGRRVAVCTHTWQR